MTYIYIYIYSESNISIAWYYICKYGISVFILIEMRVCIMMNDHVYINKQYRYLSYIIIYNYINIITIYYTCD